MERGGGAAPRLAPARLPLADGRPPQPLALDDYPAALQKDIERWQAWLSDPDPFIDRPFRALRPVSRATRLRQVRVYLAALVESGLKPEEIIELKSVVTPERARIGLRILWDRVGGVATQHTFQMAGLVLQLGRHWAKLGERDIESLRSIVLQLRPKHFGMSKRTQRRILAAAENPDRLQALIDLPATMAAAARRAGPPSKRLGLLVQTAVLIEVLLHAPIRLKNLGALRIGLQLQLTPTAEWMLTLAADETKNGAPFTTCFPKETSRLISLYVERYRPLLADQPLDWLSPGAVAGRHKTLDALRTQIRDAAADHCGLELTPHDFRSLCGDLVLRKDRGAHGKVQRILGHKNLQTTLAHYSGLEAALAVADYGALVEDLRAGSPTRSTRPSRSRPKAQAIPGGKTRKTSAACEKNRADAGPDGLTGDWS